MNIEKLTIQSEVKLRSENMNSMLNQEYSKKVNRSKALVNEFTSLLGLDTCYVSTSGGKDSACLSKLCKTVLPDIKHIMFNTGLEYQATIELAKKQGAIIVPPKISWVSSCDEHGYPIVSKNVSRRLGDIGKTPISTCIALFNQTYGLSDKWLHLTDSEFVDFKVSGYCCDEFKKKPSKQLKLNPIIGTRIQESSNRKSAWKKSGCNSYSKNMKHGVSKPISLWLDSDIEKYIVDEDVELSSLYTQFEQKRTGCKICPFGAQIDGSRFDLLKQLEPKSYDHFIWNTKLGHILMISDVDIVSDSDYMIKKNELQEKIKKWHESNADYIKYRVNLAKKHFSNMELLTALDYLDAKAPIKNYEKIRKEII